jgi:hypothetical protein
MSRVCSGCPSPIRDSSTSGLCRSCAARAKYADPTARRVMSEAKKRALADPVKRARVATTAAHNLSHWHKTTDRDWSAHNRAQAARRRSWCPDDKWGDYQALRNMKGMDAASAKAMILDEMARDERKRLASMSPFERDMERLANGAGLVATPDFRTAGPAFTLGGISSAAL